MIEPFDDNGQFRSACCPIDNSSDINCTEFFNRRPINKCKDPDYTNPVVGKFQVAILLLWRQILNSCLSC